MKTQKVDRYISFSLWVIILSKFIIIKNNISGTAADQLTHGTYWLRLAPPQYLTLYCSLLKFSRIGKNKTRILQNYEKIYRMAKLLGQ